MFDFTLTKEAIACVDERMELNTQLARLMADVADGRHYMIMNGSTTVSVVARQDGERKVVKIYPLPFLQAQRYTKEDAAKRLSAIDPQLYRVVRIREAIKAQGDALHAYQGELRGFAAKTCESTGMEGIA